MTIVVADATDLRGVFRKSSLFGNSFDFFMFGFVLFREYHHSVREIFFSLLIDFIHSHLPRRRVGWYVLVESSMVGTVRHLAGNTAQTLEWAMIFVPRGRAGISPFITR